MTEPHTTGSALFAGVANVDTTPKLGTDLGGYFTSRISDSIERRLYAKALALRSADTTLLLISVDIIMMRACDIVTEAKQRITDSTGIPASHIMISATHTHNGPATIARPGGPQVDPDYLRTVTAAIHRAAVGAVTTLVPAQLAVGQSEVTGVCFNRRYRRTDGLVDWNPGRGRDDIVEPAGPIDPTVTAILVEDLAGRPLALWSNLSLHYVNADSPTAISSDYYGAFDEQVRKTLGPTLHSQLTNGCSGDINNIDLSDAVPVQGAARADLVARSVLGAALSASTMARRHREVALSSQLTMLPLDRVTVTDDDLAIAAQVIAGEREDAPFSYVKGMPIPANRAIHYARRLQVLAELPDTAEAPIMAMTIGDLAIVGLPGEIFVEHGLAIRAGSRYAQTAMIGLANDHVGYVPTLRAYDEGNYETWRDSISWTAPGAGEAMVRAALQLVGG